VIFKEEMVGTVLFVHTGTESTSSFVNTEQQSLSGLTL